MSDTFDRLKTALADRYAIEEELGAGGMETVSTTRRCRRFRTSVQRPPPGREGNSMGPETLAIFVPIFGILGGVGLVGLKIWTNHELKMREMPDGDNERLTEAVQQLSDEVAELHERMEFTERMLSEVRSRNAIGPGDST